MELALPGSDMDEKPKMEVWVALALTLQHGRAQAQHSRVPSSKLRCPEHEGLLQLYGLHSL